MLVLIYKTHCKACTFFVHLVAGAAVEQFLMFVQVSDIKFSSTLIAFEAKL